MKSAKFGVFAAGAVASMLATAALAQNSNTEPATEAQGCYRTMCGKSVSGYPGKCAGSKVEGIADQKTCESAGGAWTTEAGAAKYKH